MFLKHFSTCLAQELHEISRTLNAVIRSGFISYRYFFENSEGFKRVLSVLKNLVRCGWCEKYEGTAAGWSLWTARDHEMGE